MTTTISLPIPLRQQADIRDEWLLKRRDVLLPELMDRTGIDFWIVLCREYNEDPVALSLVPATWLSARRRTILMFHRTADGVRAISASKYPIDGYVHTWTDHTTDQWATVRQVINDANPRVIAVDTSETFALADGVSHTEYEALVAALGSNADRIVPAEPLAIGWLERRLPEEIDAAHRLNELAHQVIAEAFSRQTITVGKTTTADVGWWIRQRFHDLGVEPWFQPTVDRQHHQPGTQTGLDDYPAIFMNHDDPIQAGDILHCDVGLKTLGLCTDTQQIAYVLPEGQSAPPAGLVAALRTGNRMQEITTAEWKPGVTGNDALASALAAANAEGIDGAIYSHPVGTHGHAAGPTIGMWDNQGRTDGQGDYPFYPDTIYALELAIWQHIPEWDNQRVMIGLEQGVTLRSDGVHFLDQRQTDWIVV